MKKNIVFILSILFLFSCSNDNSDILVNENNNGLYLESIIVESEEKSKDHLEQIYQRVLEENPNYSNFENSNADLFVNEDKLTKASNQTLSVQGYDFKNVLSKYSLTYGFPYAGLQQGVPYYTELCEYVKYVEIPKGYSIALPPPKPPIVMRVNTKSIYDSNMGYMPDNFGFNQGYSIKYVSTSGNKDKYAFVTHVEVISKNLKNNKKLSPVVYNPQGVTNPATFKFLYQIVNADW